MTFDIGDLERLAQLRRDGVITDEEFAAQKAKLLARDSGNGQGRSSPQPLSDPPLSNAWEKRFAFFRQYGWAYSPEGMKALRAIPFLEGLTIRLNFWAFFFGPFYFFFLGIPKRALSLVGICIVLGLIADKLGGDGLVRSMGFGEAFIFAMTANYYRFIKVTQGRDEWNPLTDLYPNKAPGDTTA